VSLINKMLRDLESRRDDSGLRSASPKLIYEDLRSPRTAHRGARSVGGLVLAVLVGLMVVGGYVAWDRWGRHAAVADRVAPPQAAIATAAPSVPPVTASAIPADVGAAPAPPIAPSPKSKPQPAAAPVARAATVTVARSNGPVRRAAKPAVKANAGVPTKVIRAAALNGGEPVIEKTAHPLSPAENAEQDYREALKFVDQGRMDDAQAKLAAALAANPAHVNARELLAGLSLQRGHAAEAKKLLEEGIATVPGYYPFAQLLARELVQEGAEPQALSLLEKSRAAAAQDADYIAFLAVLYQRAGNHPAAVQAYRQALSLKPGEGRWWLGLGMSFDAEQKTTAAQDAYARALASGNLDAKLREYAQQRVKH
jgi:MSHA biogenesis protein MshN